MPDVLFHDLPIEDMRKDVQVRDRRTGELFWIVRVDYADELLWLVSEAAASAPRAYRLVPAE